LEAQATYKSAKKAESRRQKTGMDDLFAEPNAIDPGERSAVEIAGGVSAGQTKMIQMLEESPEGLDWKQIWPRVLDACVVTYSELGDCVRLLRDNGKLEIPGWTNAALKRPKDEFRIYANTIS
jgi:hypothetical protein